MVTGNPERALWISVGSNALEASPPKNLRLRTLCDTKPSTWCWVATRAPQTVAGLKEYAAFFLGELQAAWPAFSWPVHLGTVLLSKCGNSSSTAGSPSGLDLVLLRVPGQHMLVFWKNPFYRKHLDYMGVSFNGGTPNLHPKSWSFLVGKPMVVGYHHFRKPPYPSHSNEKLSGFRYDQNSCNTILPFAQDAWKKFQTYSPKWWWKMVI